MRYEVPNLQLIPQSQTMSCWYASAEMLLRWRQRSGTLFEPPHPLRFPELEAHVRANDGMPQREMIQFAERLGLRRIPHLTRLPNVVEMQTLVMMNGPIWTNGVPVNAAGIITSGNHVVVVGGVDNLTSQVLVLDPSPVGSGTRSWRPFTHLGQIVSDRNNPQRPVTFLHYPPRAQ